MTRIRSNGVFAINYERERQIDEEGYDAEHDAGHADELAHAAAAYALADEWRGSDEGTQAAPPVWPWSPVYWKPTPENRIRELVKAGALIAAALDDLWPDDLAASPGARHDVPGALDVERLLDAVIDALGVWATMGNGEGWTIDADIILRLWGALSYEDRARSGYDVAAMDARYEAIRPSRDYPPLAAPIPEPEPGSAS